MPGDQELEVALTSVAGEWPAQTWLFANNRGWNHGRRRQRLDPRHRRYGPAFSHCMFDTDGTRHALAQWNADEPSREFCDDDILPGRSTHSLPYSPPIIPVVYYDFSAIPVGSTIESAWLIVSPATLVAHTLRPGPRPHRDPRHLGRRLRLGARARQRILQRQPRRTVLAPHVLGIRRRRQPGPLGSRR